MARAPFQILVLPFRVASLDVFEYALFKRSDKSYWQGIAGGGEDSETPLAAAKREAFEEAHVPLSTPFFALQTTSMIPVYHFKAQALWSQARYVIPQYCYAADCSAITVCLSDEHSEYRWVEYDEAVTLLRWDDNKTALWELQERLRNHDLRVAL